MSEAVPIERRYPNGRLYRSYEERVERGWISSIAKRTYPRPASARAIISETAAEHGVPVEAILSPSRKQEVTRARWDAMTRLRAYEGFTFSLSHVAALLGLKDHSSVIHGLQRWAEINREAA